MEHRKRIVFTVINDLVHDQRMQRICASLSGNGYDVMLVGRVQAGSDQLPEQSFEQKRLRCWFNKGKMFYFEYNIRLFFLLLFAKAHVLGPVDDDTLVPAFIVSKIRSLQLVFDAHEYFSEVPEVVCRPVVRRVWQWVEKVFYPAIRFKYTVSESLAGELGKKYKTHFDVIRNVPVLRDYEVAESPIRFVLYQGALNEGRALEELIMAMHHVDAKLKLAGEGDIAERLRELVRKESLTHKVEFMGWVAPNELKKITAGAAIGYNLLHHVGESYYYSLSNKFFDYIHAGVPSLNPNFPEYKRILNEYEVGVVCAPQADAIAGVMNQLLTDAAFYHKLQQQCLLARQQFNWQAEEKKLLHLYAGFR